jgi:histidinol-phosphate aminotransferase
MPPYRSSWNHIPVELRLDMNENTTGCSPRVLAKIRELSANTVAYYPDRERAERIVAQFLGRPVSQVLLTNGADEGIDLVCRAFLEADDEMIVVTPTFPMYEVFACGAGARIMGVPAGPDYGFPLPDVLAAITPRTRIIVITNPHNPTGAVASDADILTVLRKAPDAAVLVDEAYFEFYGNTMINAVGTVPNLFIVRTFSKAYGLAGMRLGVLAGPSEHMSMMRRMVSPFNINVFAIECMRAALDDQEFVRAYVAQVRATREWFREQVEALGFKCWPSQANFVLIRLGEHKDTILKQVAGWGIAIRDRSDCPGCVRVSIGKQDEMEVVLLALKKALALAAGRQKEQHQEQPAS